MVDNPSLFADLIFVEVRIFDLADERVHAELGEPVTTFLLLRLVERIDHCRVQDLSRHLGLTVGGASKAVDRMEREGYLRREAHPHDRRSSTLVLTATGRRVLRRATRLVDETVAEHLGDAARLGPVLARLRDQLTV